MKYVDTKIVFQELPNEITLAINISGCPCACIGCHSSYLSQDIGESLTKEALQQLIRKNKGITAILFMGGDANPAYINKLAEYLYHNYPNLKIGWYSGRDKLSEEIKLDFFHYIKLGPYISSKGPLNNPNTNQRLYQVVKRENDINLFDITSYFTNNHEHSKIHTGYEKN